MESEDDFEDEERRGNANATGCPPFAERICIYQSSLKDLHFATISTMLLFPSCFYGHQLQGNVQVYNVRIPAYFPLLVLNRNHHYWIFFPTKCRRNSFEQAPFTLVCSPENAELCFLVMLHTWCLSLHTGLFPWEF